jgi:hypothetical protein
VANDRTERAALLRFLLSFLSLSSHSPALPFAPASRHRNHGFPSSQFIAALFASSRPRIATPPPDQLTEQRADLVSSLYVVLSE